MDRFHIAALEPSLHTQIQDKECAKSRAFVSNLRVVFLQMLETLSQWESPVIMKLNMKLIAPNAARHLTTSLHNSPEILEHPQNVCWQGKAHGWAQNGISRFGPMTAI